MESSVSKHKRRSQYGSRLSLPNKSFRLSIPDRVKYNITEDVNNIYPPESLFLLTQHNWNLYRVSHFYKIEYSTVKFKQYAAHIKQELVKNIKDTTTNVSFNVKVTVFPDVKELNGDSKSLQIEVFYKKDENKPVLKYRSLILSWDNNNTKNFTYLPLLLCVGSVNITKIVHQTLSNLFDTLLHRLRISENNLLWLSAVLSESTNNVKNITYDFSLHESSLKNSIKVSLPSNVIENMWKIVHPAMSKEISYNEVQKFHDRLQNQLLASFGINFKLLKLNRIIMSDATIAKEGKIKIHSENATETILSFITDISIILDTCYPETCDEMSDTV